MANERDLAVVTGASSGIGYGPAIAAPKAISTSASPRRRAVLICINVGRKAIGDDCPSSLLMDALRGL